VEALVVVEGVERVQLQEQREQQIKVMLAVMVPATILMQQVGAEEQDKLALLAQLQLVVLTVAAEFRPLLRVVL
jgi:hypothetical protein